MSSTAQYPDSLFKLAVNDTKKVKLTIIAILFRPPELPECIARADYLQPSRKHLKASIFSR